MNTKELMPLLNLYISGVDERWNYLHPAELEGAVRRGENLFLLDVRRPEDYARGHIAGAVNIFWLEALEPHNLALLPRDRRIVVICYVGHTASQLMVLLRLLGYDAVVLKYGMGRSPISGIPVAGWENYGFGVVGGEGK